MKKKAATLKKLSAPQAYGKGYRRGRDSQRLASATIIAALNGQIDYWRDRYESLRNQRAQEAETPTHDTP